jgi:tetratricopeptide (TPR) repeat protein
VPIDRPAILRNAEKLLRQGKLDQAAAEYLRIVDDQPSDWNTANLLGDLYVRAKQVDKAVDQFVRIADHLREEGFLPKAAAVYKKILKLKPDHEHALLQAGDIAGVQGLTVDARALFRTIMDRRRSHGDQRGVAEIVVRLGSLDPNDFDARVAAARARIELDERQGALDDLRTLATYLQEKERLAEAGQALREAAAIDPENTDISGLLMDLSIAAGDYDEARRYATTARLSRLLVERLEAAGQADEALRTLRDAADRHDDDALKTQLGMAIAARGDIRDAVEYLTIETAGDDARLLLTLAEARLRDGRIDEGAAAVRRLLELDADRRHDVAAMGWTVAERSPDAGFALVQLATDAAIAESDYGSAAAALQEYVTRVPNHIPALIRLVGVCADGGLEATMSNAQAQLAEAYIDAGAGDEARFIAEELIAREPWERANLERFRRVLVLLGEADPDNVIAERLSGRMPFMSTDLARSADADPPVGNPPSAVSLGAASTVEPIDPRSLDRASNLSTAAEATGASHEVDLTVVLEDMHQPEPEAQPEPEPPAREPVAPAPVELEGVFAQMREDVSRRGAFDGAENDYRQGMSLYEAGRGGEALGPLQKASRAPKFRFVSAAVVARIFRDQGEIVQAVEWFERAAQAPAPNVEEGHALLFELADALEQQGETARALAVCMELQADAGNYRDVGARIERLASGRARG